MHRLLWGTYIILARSEYAIVCQSLPPVGRSVPVENVHETCRFPTFRALIWSGAEKRVPAWSFDGMMHWPWSAPLSASCASAGETRMSGKDSNRSFAVGIIAPSPSSADSASAMPVNWHANC